MLKRCFSRVFALLLAVIIFTAVLSGCQSAAVPQAEPLPELSYNNSDYFDPDKVYSVGDRFLFGKYEQDGNTENGKEYIEWRVLSNEAGRALVVSEFGLDYVPYNKYEDVVIEWRKSSLRKWLNNEFVAENFTEEEQQKILYTPNANKGYLYYDMSTRDQMFCLSAQEAEKFFSSAEDRILQPTAYALSVCGKSTFNDANNHWWLRNAGMYQSYAAYVTADGVTNISGMKVDIGPICMRPAFYISCARAETHPNIYNETEALYFDPETTYAAGDRFLFGAYEQDGNTDNGSEYIEWRVLEVNKESKKIFAMTEYGVDSVWYEPNSSILFGNIDWESCYLRAWLNDVFACNAFSEAEAGRLEITEVNNKGNAYTEMAGGENTQDKVFCLSIDEVQQYYPLDEDAALNALLAGGNIMDILGEQLASRICIPTEYTIQKCKAVGNDEYNREGAFWWLRSPGGLESYSAHVTNEGEIDYTGTSHKSETTAVRPVCWISTESAEVNETE